MDENTSATNLDFVYRSRIAALLAPGRDKGVMAHGRFLHRGLLRYEFGIFTEDGSNARTFDTDRVHGERTIACRPPAVPPQQVDRQRSNVRRRVHEQRSASRRHQPARPDRFRRFVLSPRVLRQRPSATRRPGGALAPGSVFDQVGIHPAERRASRAERRQRRSRSVRRQRLLHQRHVGADRREQGRWSRRAASPAFAADAASARQGCRYRYCLGGPL